MAKARPKGTTPKALQFTMKQRGTNTNGGARSDSSSFRVLYYGDASAGSVPFLWESRPGTPKHPTTESSLPPLTPPPAFHQSGGKYNSATHSSSLRSLFLATSSRKTHVAPPSSMSDSSMSSSKQPTSLRSLLLASSSRKSHLTVAPPSCSSPPMSKEQGKTEFRWRRAGTEDGVGKHEGGDGSPTSARCFGGVLMKSYRMTKGKNALTSIGGHGNKVKGKDNVEGSTT